MRTRKNLKLEVSPDDTTLTLQDIVSRRVQWRRSIDVDPATTLVSITPSHSLTTLASILPKPQLELPILDQLFLSPPQTQSTPPTPHHTQPATAPKKSTKIVRAKSKPERMLSKA
jgi:hypothetical protein